MKLDWSLDAIADRRGIRANIAQHDIAAALALDELFTRKAAMLLNMPAMGKPGRLSGTRELVAHRHYILVYEVLGDVVNIIRVMHTARQWPPQRS